MQNIPTTFQHAGWTLDLIRRQGDVAMFKAANRPYWEIHRILRRPAGVVFGHQCEDRELLASASEFGRRAWACVTQERADARFSEALA